MAKVLLLAPTDLSTDDESEVTEDRRSRVEHTELARALRAAGVEAEIIDYASVDRDRGPWVGAVRRVFGDPAALALVGFLRRQECDAFFSSGEAVTVPLALLLKFCRFRPGHVSATYEMSKPKTRFFYRWLRIHRQIDTTIVYCTTQRDYATGPLRIPAEQVALIHGHVDARFYRPLDRPAPDPRSLCSAGLAKRDYATLIRAVADVPEASLTAVPAGHPLRLNRRAIPDIPIPPNVSFPDFEPGGLRELYASAAVVCLTLREGNSAAGVTTLLEAMAMAKPVILTRTAGLADYVADGETALCVAPEDVEGWKRAIRRLQGDAALRERLGRNARRWVEQNSTMEIWSGTLVRALQIAASRHVRPGATAAAAGPRRLF